MAVGKFGRHVKRPYGLGVKVASVVLLGLCFIVAWSLFASPSSSVYSQRSSFGDISAPISERKKGKDPHAVAGSEAHLSSTAGRGETPGKEKGDAGKGSKDRKGIAHGGGLHKKDGGRVAEDDEEEAIDQRKEKIDPKQELIAEKNANETERAEDEESKKESEDEGITEEGADEDVEIDGETVQDPEKIEDKNNNMERKGKKKKNAGPLFDSRAHYTWKSCNVRSKHNYIPCIDIERTTGKLQSYRHRERICPRTPSMCLVHNPEGYASPVHWPESKMKVYISGE